MNEFYDYDVFINMPITKDHAGNKFTGTIKNLMGLNAPTSTAPNSISPTGRPTRPPSSIWKPASST